VFGRFSVGDVPPETLAFIRWRGAFLIVLPFACRNWRVWDCVAQYCWCQKTF
jgi:hypothetical protein